MRLRARLTCVLAALLLMQWGTAFAHCLRLAAPAAGFAVEICTADGLRHVTLQDGDEGGGGEQAVAAICPACQGPGAFALPVPPVTLVPPVVPVAAADPPPPPSPALPTPPRCCQPRAPPIS